MIQTSNFNLIWLLSYLAVASVSAAIITPALPEIQQAYHLSLGAVGWIVSSFLIGYVVGQLIYGPLANTCGRLKALSIGLYINLLGIAVCVLSLYNNSYYLLMLGRFITGLGSASGLACTFMLINEWLPKHQRKAAMAYSVFSFALGVGFAVMIGGIITQYWHWQGCFWFLLVHGLIMLWGTRIFSETLVTQKPLCIRTISYDYSRGFSSPSLVIFSLIVGSCAAVSYCFAAAGPQISQDVLGLSAAQYGYWNILNTVGMLLGGLCSKQLLSRWSVGSVIVFGLAGMGFGIASLVLMWGLGSHSALWFFLMTASLYLFSSFLFAGGSLIASNALTDKASAAAIMSFINMCFATLCVIIMGYLAANPFTGFVIILSFIQIIIVGLFALARRVVVT